MEYMFYNCKSLNNLDLSFLNFKNVNNINYMLYNCKNYKNLDYQGYFKSFNIERNNIFGSIMTIIYNIDGNEIKLFGDDFVKDNKDNCYLLIEGKKESLCSYWKLNKTDKKLLEIKLIEIKTITNMSYMFYDCSSLNNLEGISKWDTKSVTNMSLMFFGCATKKIPKNFLNK